LIRLREEEKTDPSKRTNTGPTGRRQLSLIKIQCSNSPKQPSSAPPHATPTPSSFEHTFSIIVIVVCVHFIQNSGFKIQTLNLNAKFRFLKSQVIFSFLVVVMHGNGRTKICRTKQCKIKGTGRPSEKAFYLGTDTCSGSDTKKAKNEESEVDTNTLGCYLHSYKEVMKV
jgi:hypothetical protein